VRLARIGRQDFLALHAAPSRLKISNNSVMPAKHEIAPQRGIYEKVKGSGIWWIRWTDSEGHKRREKAGNHSVAKTLLLNRQAEKPKGVKLPDNVRAKSITFGALCDDALKHSAAENSTKQTYELGLRIDQLRPVFGNRPALHLIRTKNGDPRVIPLNSVALAALDQLKGTEDRPATEPVFPSVRTGDSLQGSRGWFSTALDEAKVLDYTWHCNRHTFAGRLVMAGVDLRTVAELLGHRTLQMVMRYSHLGPEHQTSAVDRLVNFQGQKGHQNGHRRVQGENSKNTQTRK
jgi:hypothetical protein